MIRSYKDQLKTLADAAGVDLKQAFDKAGIPDSTYYRSVIGPRNLSLDTAETVSRAIAQLSAEAS